MNVFYLAGDKRILIRFVHCEKLKNNKRTRFSAKKFVYFAGLDLIVKLKFTLVQNHCKWILYDNKRLFSPNFLDRGVKGSERVLAIDEQ